MEFIRLEIDASHLLFGHLYTLVIRTPVEFAFYQQSTPCACPGNQIHDRRVSEQRAATPVLAYERKEPVFDFVPLARARRKVAHRNRQPAFIRELL